MSYEKAIDNRPVIRHIVSESAVDIGPRIGKNEGEMVDINWV
jgi:hypothetical protein